jgi:hypothetical protein
MVAKTPQETARLVPRKFARHGKPYDVGRLAVKRRLFVAAVATELCGGSARQAERRFGWGRAAVEKGLHESCSGVRCLENFAARGRPRSEEKHPQLAADIRAIVEPFTQADPELKSSRRYTNLSAG